jgi:hypothetical protein
VGWDGGGWVGGLCYINFIEGLPQHIIQVKENTLLIQI